MGWAWAIIATCVTSTISFRGRSLQPQQSLLLSIWMVQTDCCYSEYQIDKSWRTSNHHHYRYACFPNGVLWCACWSSVHGVQCVGRLDTTGSLSKRGYFIVQTWQVVAVLCIMTPLLYGGSPMSKNLLMSDLPWPWWNNLWHAGLPTWPSAWCLLGCLYSFKSYWFALEIKILLPASLSAFATAWALSLSLQVFKRTLASCSIFPDILIRSFVSLSDARMALRRTWNIYAEKKSSTP